MKKIGFSNVYVQESNNESHIYMGLARSHSWRCLL